MSYQLECRLSVVLLHITSAATCWLPCRRLKCPLPDCHTGYVMQSVDDPVRKETNPNPKWAVPTELIEWQPSYTQRGAQGLEGGAWSANWAFSESTKCVHLLKRLYEIGAAVNPAQPEIYSQRVSDTNSRTAPALAAAESGDSSTVDLLDFPTGIPGD